VDAANPPPRRRASVRSSLLVALILAACGPTQEAGFEQLPHDPDAVGDPVAPASLAGCELLERGLERDAATLASMDPGSMLEEIPVLSWSASALNTPQMQQQLDRFGEVTVLAPIDRPLDGDDGDFAGPLPGPNDPEPPPEALVHPGAALRLADLLQAGDIEVADGGSVEVELRDDQAFIVRDGVAVEVICADLVLDDAVIHVVQGIPYPLDPDGREPEGEPDPDAVTP
jgi:hypothetical protein